MSEESPKTYTLFNGRRSADEYVKGYLKGILAISAGGLTIVLMFAGWSGISIINQSTRLVKIESSRFTVADGAKLRNEINNNKLGLTDIRRIEQKLDSFIAKNEQDWNEFKSLMRRAAPYELDSSRTS